MSKSKFSKPPMTDEEKEKKLNAFLNLSEAAGAANSAEKPEGLPPKKEESKTLYLRVPESLWADIHELMLRSGLSMNAICIDLLRPGVRQRLKDIKDVS